MRNHPAAYDPKGWREVRALVFERDGRRCVECGRTDGLECDHRTPVKDGGDPWDMANLQTLCRGCHIAKTRRDNAKPKTPHQRQWAALVADLTGGG
ncbi:MAG: HNH endonuclease signature motif containing protein [Gammaproteobacteria bacterium]|nr:HNH endonuclease signature motif containing protein [Gammaproteobacteria bacterium]